MSEDLLFSIWSPVRKSSKHGLKTCQAIAAYQATSSRGWPKVFYQFLRAVAGKQMSSPLIFLIEVLNCLAKRHCRFVLIVRLKMRIIKSILISISTFCILSNLAPPGWSQAAVDNSIYEELLKRYVKNGVVDYRGFKKEEGKLDEYLKVLENTKVSELVRNEQFAFYVNAYNAWTIKLILSAYPGIESIKDLGNIFKSPWGKKIVRLNGRVLTLDDIEHGILRVQFKDPRVHFAINCASKSCPPLLSEPYRGSTLNRQLDDATRSFINDPKSNYLKDSRLYVSRIFKWYSEDFNDDVIGFFLKYAEGDFKKELEAKKDQLKIVYLDYDWSLNGA